MKILMASFTLKRIGLKYYPSLSDKELLGIIRKTFVLEPDNAQFAGSYAPDVKFYDKNFAIGVGLLPSLVSKCEKLGHTIEINGNSLNHHSFIPTSMNPMLRPHQKEAVENFAANCIGIIQIPTRGGKTFVAGECIAQVLKRDKNEKVLFLVDSLSLLTQTVKELTKYLGFNVGIIQGATFTPKTVTVASIQTITSIISSAKKHAKFDKYIKYRDSVSFLIIDEIHEFGSENRVDSIFGFTNIKYLLGLSATPYRSNGVIPKTRIRSYAVDIKYKVNEEGLVEGKVLVENKTLMLSYAATGKHREMSGIINNPIERFNERRRVLIYENTQRLELINYLVEFLNQKKIPTVVMTNSVPHGKLISKRCNLPFICGEDGEDKRNRVTNDFLKGKVNTLLVSEIYKKGITLPEAQVIINVSGGKETSLIMQKRGRVLGASKGKSRALLIDIFDEHAYSLTDHAEARVNHYKTIGVVDNLAVQSGVFKEEFSKYINEWFN